MKSLRNHRRTIRESSRVVWGKAPCARSRHLRIESLEDRRLLTAAIGQPAIELFDVSPAVFVENQGQWPDESVRYAFHGTGANVLHTDTGPVFQLFEREAADSSHLAPQDEATSRGARRPLFLDEPEEVVTHTTQFSVTFDGANRVAPVGLDRAETVFNYYLGEQSNWRSNVPGYETVAYLGLYDGIDLLTFGRRDSLKYEFHVAPGADWRSIRISYEGIEGLWLDDDGALHVEPKKGTGPICAQHPPGRSGKLDLSPFSLAAAAAEGDSPIFAAQKSGQSPWGELVDEAPFIYQVVDGRQVEVSGAFTLIDADTYTFEVSGPYDPSAELIIDPELAWSTYLGGSGIDGGTDMIHGGDGIAVDAAGNVLVTGRTESSGWTAGGYDTTHNGGGSDAFVAKLSPNGGHLWSTYLGGNNLDWGTGIAVDAWGDALVTGRTESSGWTAGGCNTTHNGGGPDAFVAKLGPNGGHLWSTYLGGSDFDYGDGIAVDAWVAGGYDSTYNGGSRDAFVAKLGPNGGHLWSTYLGGNDDDWGYGIAVDASGNALVTGRTDESSGWTAGGYNTTYNGGGADAFVAKLPSSGPTAGTSGPRTSAETIGIGAMASRWTPRATRW